MSTQVVEKIPAGYITRERAMEILEKSDTSIERLVRTGELQSKLFPAPGRRPIRYYMADSVQAFKELEQRKIAARPPSQFQKTVTRLLKEREQPEPLALTVPDAAVATLRELVERLTAPKPVPVTEKLWLTINEAVELSGLPRAFLDEAIWNSRLPALATGTGQKRVHWRIRRSDLEAFGG